MYVEIPVVIAVLPGALVLLNRGLSLRFYYFDLKKCIREANDNTVFFLGNVILFWKLICNGDALKYSVIKVKTKILDIGNWDLSLSPIIYCGDVT